MKIRNARPVYVCLRASAREECICRNSFLLTDTTIKTVWYSNKCCIYKNRTQKKHEHIVIQTDTFAKSCIMEGRQGSRCWHWLVKHFLLSKLVVENPRQQIS